jgi:hypothetical protein
MIPVLDLYDPDAEATDGRADRLVLAARLVLQRSRLLF